MPRGMVIGLALLLAGSAQAQWQLGSRSGWGGAQRGWDGSLQERTDLVARHRGLHPDVTLEVRSGHTVLTGEAPLLLAGRWRVPVAQRSSWTLRGEHDVPGLRQTWWGWWWGDRFGHRALASPSPWRIERGGELFIGQALPWGDLMLYAGRRREGPLAARGWRAGPDAEQRRSLEWVWQCEVPAWRSGLEASRLQERASWTSGASRLQSTRLLWTHASGWRGLLERERDVEEGVPSPMTQWRWGLLWTRAL